MKRKTFIELGEAIGARFEELVNRIRMSLKCQPRPPKGVPIHIYCKSLQYDVIDYAKEYPGDKTVNFANGEIIRLSLSGANDIIGKNRLLGSGRDYRGEYDTIMVWLGEGWVKVISKTY